jgi:hypothetical protein
VELKTSYGPVPIRIVNVSVTGMYFVGAVPRRAGEKVSFVTLGDKISARVVRRDRKGGALAFDEELNEAQLGSLRQIRDAAQAGLA